MIKQLEKRNALEDVDIDEEASEPDRVPYSIDSYGTDFDIHGLVRRVKDKEIYIPNFQRAFVWTREQSSRLIESILLGLPIPAIFLSKDEDKRLLVIDGQQRLKTLKFFYDGTWGDDETPELKTKGEFTEFKLTGLDKSSTLLGKTYATLAGEEKRQLDNYPLHAIIIRQNEPINGDTSESDSSIFYIFERLNTGGTFLRPQEIRTAVYDGPFNDLLKTLNSNSEWRTLFGLPKPHTNLKDQEFILRFFALYYHSTNYEEPMKSFLNEYMAENRKLRKVSAKELTALFEKTIATIHRCLQGKSKIKAFRPEGRLNIAVFDATMVGVAKRLEQGDITDCKAFVAAHENLLGNPEFRTVTGDSTADAEKVKTRLRLAIKAFSQLA
jgi:hypothetical protein